jgi:N-acetylneuraminate synthase/pseudaminic acid synthase|tara:strand:- start:690 stop:1754 length:1065 start_codon:yes stop_codon:yes gene_type:complete
VKFKIGKTFIGDNLPSFIVAELSGNHNGEFQRMKKMVFKAKKAGANAVKLQTYTPDTITLKSNKSDFKIIKNDPWKKIGNLWNLYNGAFTPWIWHKKIFRLARKLKLEVFSSPFDESAVELLESLNCSAYKIASAEINHIPLLEKVAKTKKPVILSTGLANQSDIQFALKTLKKNGCSKIAVLKCISSYPAPIEEQNLKTIADIRKKFNVISGLSDHTLGITSAIASVVVGGSIIEKHFNLDDNKKTVDSFFSIKTEDFKNMVKEIRRAEVALGDVDYNISLSSRKNINSRRSIYISSKINKDEILSTKNTKVIRPNFGLHPKFYKKILGKKVNKTLDKGTRLKLKYIKKNNKN